MMKLSAQTTEGRVLQALRAGEMTSAEMYARFGSSSIACRLVKAGYAERTVGEEGGGFRITAAGRAACPYRNPLAAPGAVQPITIKEATMPREKGLTRNDVLNAILAAGPHGITRSALVEQFDCVGIEGRIDMHITKLVREKPALVARPRLGFVIASSYVPEMAAAQQKMSSALKDAPTPPLQPGAGFTDGGMPSPAAVSETIEITTPGDRRGPVVFEDIDSEFALFSSGRIEISDGRNTVVIRGAALNKLNSFLQVLA